MIMNPFESGPVYRNQDKTDFWELSSKNSSDEILVYVKGKWDIFRPPLPDELYMFEWHNSYNSMRYGAWYTAFIFRLASDIIEVPIQGYGTEIINQLADWVIFYTRIMRGQ